MTKGSDAKTQRAPVTGARINRVATVIHADDCDYERAVTDPVRPQSENQAAILLAAIFFLRASQTVRTSDVVSEHSSICKKYRFPSSR